ncbi:MAG TPA: ParB/RepB/Spo0J family partition protein [Bryobacteraceae bacterium]|jgi:ParB/RepB/Spo0J family partition protein
MTTELPVKSLEPSPTNPRKTIDKTTIAELAESIKTNGLLQPLLVRPLGKSKDRYEVVCGNRRLLALRQTGLEKCPVTVRELTDEEAVDAQQVENLQREDVPPLEEGEAFAALVKKYNVEMVAFKVGKTPAFIRRRIMLTRLTGDARTLLQKGELPIKSAEMIAGIEDEKARKALVDGLRWAGKSPEDIAGAIRQTILQKISKAPFDTRKVYGCADEQPTTCDVCPFNTAAKSGSLFPELAKDAQCTNGKCFRAKTDAHYQIKVDEHLQKGGSKLGEQDAKKCWPRNYYSGGDMPVSDRAPFIELSVVQPLFKKAKVDLPKDKVFIVRNPSTQKVHYVVARDFASKVMPKPKKEEPTRSRGESAAAKLKYEIETAVREQAQVAYATEFAKLKAIDGRIHRALANILGDEIHGSDWELFAKAFATETPPQGKGYDAAQKWGKKFLAGLDKNQLPAFIVLAIAMKDCYGATPEIRALATAAGVDCKKLEANVTKQVKAQLAERKNAEPATKAAA